MALGFTVLVGFQWQDLPKGGTVVDVGGGVGSSSLIVAKAVPDLNIVIQDRPPTITDAEEVLVRSNLYREFKFAYRSFQFWKSNMPSAITSGRVKLQGSACYGHHLSES